MLIALFSCRRTENASQESPQNINDSINQNKNRKKTAMETDKANIIIDCNYTFAEAIAGTKAPDSVIDSLKLITVEYYSTDGKIHRGQVLTNRKIADEIEEIFKFILQQKFPVYQVIPVVKYDWNDERSMEDNNSYSFCYRDITYSKHATGMAIDINPFFNPVRWKEEYSYRKNKPEGAVYNPEVPGTFYETQPVVEKFKEMGFKWGHNFSRNHDDHHFEKINYK
jgi:hypothetical protein